MIHVLHNNQLLEQREYGGLISPMHIWLIENTVGRIITRTLEMMVSILLTIHFGLEMAIRYPLMKIIGRGLRRSLK